MKLKILSLLVIFCNQGFSVDISLPVILENAQKNNVQDLLDNIRNLLSNTNTNKQEASSTIRKLVNKKFLKNTPILFSREYIDRTVDVFFCKNNDQELSITILKDLVYDLSENGFPKPAFDLLIESILKKKENQVVEGVAGKKNQQTSSNSNLFSSEIAKKVLASWNLKKFGEKER
ncbi:hypothetical protein, partial [Holospora obtusa]|uniref:hypothetical protein n=1 Tax=Holospora obtusa TaxID=49893 RepID=UPI00058B05EC